MDTKTSGKIWGAANIIMITMVFSRILGFVRDIIIYVQFGQNSYTDAYNAAFSIPDFLYMLLVGGALSSAFIPVFSSYIAKNQEEEGWQVVSIVFNWIMCFLVIGVTLGIIFTPTLVNILVPGFDEATLNLTVILTRIMFIQVIFMSLSGISTGILHSHKIFVPSAVGSLIYNVGIILGGVVLAAPIEAAFPGFGIAGFSIGVVLGALLNFLIQLPALLRIGMKYTFSFDYKHPGVKTLIALIVPVFFGLAVSEINLFVNQNLASQLGEGMVAALKSAQRLMQLPISIFGISVAVAFFPTMTGYAAQNDMPAFKNSVMMSLRSVIFITIPAAFGLAALREPIIRFMFEFSTGAFTSESTENTAYALLFYTFGIFAYSGIHVLSRAFYSLQDTRTPVMAAVFSLFVNIALSLLLIDVLYQGGLALAYSMAGIYNLVILLILLQRKIGHIGLKDLGISTLKMIGASLAMALVVNMIVVLFEAYLPMDSKIWQSIELIVTIGIAAVIYAIITLTLKMPEAETVMNIFKRKLGRK